MKIQTLAKLALAGLLFAGALFTTGCEKSPEDEATDVMQDASDAMEEATN